MGVWHHDQSIKIRLAVSLLVHVFAPGGLSDTAENRGKEVMVMSMIE